MRSLNTRRNARTRRAWPLGRGFTLLELAIVAVIVVVLMKLALPSYRDKVYRGRRADGTTALADLANRMEAYYGQNNTYATATIAAGVAATDVLSSATSVQGYYTLSIQSSNATTYTIQAAPAGTQTGDTVCATLRLTSANVKTITGTGTVASCW